MKRGPSMPRGIAFALPVALRRGHVMIFIPSLVNIGEFLIAGNGFFVLVGIRFARRIRAALNEIEAEFAGAITDLRLAPRTGPVSCELWLYSRYGTLRHFRVNDTALAETDLYGLPLDLKKPAAVVSTESKEPAPAPETAARPVLPATVPADSRDPILRYLAKWNAARSEGRKVWEANGSELRTILNAAGAAPKKKRASDRKPGDPGPAVPGGPGLTGKDRGIPG